MKTVKTYFGIHEVRQTSPTRANLRFVELNLPISYPKDSFNERITTMTVSFKLMHDDAYLLKGRPIPRQTLRLAPNLIEIKGYRLRVKSEESWMALSPPQVQQSTQHYAFKINDDESVTMVAPDTIFRSTVAFVLKRHQFHMILACLPDDPIVTLSSLPDYRLPEVYQDLYKHPTEPYTLNPKYCFGFEATSSSFKELPLERKQLVSTLMVLWHRRGSDMNLLPRDVMYMLLRLLI